MNRIFPSVPSLTENPVFFKKNECIYCVNGSDTTSFKFIYQGVIHLWRPQKMTNFVTMSAYQEEMLYPELEEEMSIASHIQLFKVRLLKYTFIPPVIN